MLPKLTPRRTGIPLKEGSLTGQSPQTYLKMINEIKEAEEFFAQKLKREQLTFIPPGSYAIPTQTSKGPAYMRVDVKDYFTEGMSNFSLYKDEELKETWYDKPLDCQK